MFADFADKSQSIQSAQSASIREICGSNNTGVIIWTKTTLNAPNTASINGKEFDWNSIIPYFEYEGLPKVEGTSIEGADFANSRQFERYIKDEQFIQEYAKKAQSNKWLKAILWFWQFSSDYGRSFGR
jgi:hypothetical protein